MWDSWLFLIVGVIVVVAVALYFCALYLWVGCCYDLGVYRLAEGSFVV